VYKGASVAAFQAMDPAAFARHNAATSPGEFALSPAVRSRMRFQPHNLLSPSPWQGQFDVVFLRNVLIYFSPEDTRRVVDQVAPALTAGGELIIGESESLTAMDVPFAYVRPQVYQKAGG
jgi:chemotaxis protein methyltransferase CheR